MKKNTIRPEQKWTDTNGNKLHIQAPQIRYENGYYYHS